MKRSPLHQFRFRFRAAHYISLVLLLYFLISGVYFYRAVKESAWQGVSQLEAGVSSITTNPKTATEQFSNSSLELEQSFAELRNLPTVIKASSVLPPFRWYTRFLKATDYLSQAGKTAGQLVETIPTPSSSSDVSKYLSQASQDLLNWQETEKPNIDLLASELKLANTELTAVPDWIFFGRSAQLATLKVQVAKAILVLDTIQNTTPEIRKALGSETPGQSLNYLILFQNDSELRPSGGFLGSYAILTASGGYIRSFNFGTDIYKLNGQLISRATKELNSLGVTNPKISSADKHQNIAADSSRFQTPYQAVFNPPAALSTITPTWGFLDSNLSLPFRKELLQQTAHFYELATGSQISGVISLDTTVLESFLRLTGPLQLPKSNTWVDADNVRNTLTTEIEQTWWEDPSQYATGSPKDILNQFIPVLLDAAQKRKGPASDYLPILQSAFNRSSIQLWVNSEKLEDLLEKIQPIDRVSDRQNWLKVVNSNIAGLKSSHSVVQKVEVKKQGSDDVYFYYSLSIERKHQGSNVWPDGYNRNFTQIYLPYPAEIVSLPEPVDAPADFAFSDYIKKLNSKNKIDSWTPWVDSQESSWQRVNFWFSLAPGQTGKTKLTYRIPKNLMNQEIPTVIPQAGQPLFD